MQAFSSSNSWCLRPHCNFVGFAIVALFVSGVFLLAPFRAKADLQLEIAWSGTNVVLTWINAGATLECSLTVTGLWSEVTNAVSPYPVAPTNLAAFYRLRAAEPGFDFRYVAPLFTTSIGDPFGCGCTSPENPNSLAAGGNAQDISEGKTPEFG